MNVRELSGWFPSIAKAIALACSIVALSATAGCGPTLFTFNIVPASSSVHQAEQAGAPEWSPYEYWLAHEYLDNAAEEANEGNYGDAIRFAERAHELARTAQEQTSSRMQFSQPGPGL